MCGIAGIIANGALDISVVARMSGSIAHRGPDDEGMWSDAEAAVALGHRRLSIVDLSPAGHQPMHSHDQRWVLNFNGEIYNHGELRRELEESGVAANWRGHSDTETLLECIAAWGLRKAIDKAVGMFAVALWDRRERVLHLVRDRFGEKPLYYGWVGKDFVFGSEIKALRAHPHFHNTISRRALALYAARTHVPAPLSIYERVYKLPPGCMLAVPVEAAASPLDVPPSEGTVDGGIRLERYWSYREVMRGGLDRSIDDEGDAREQLEQALGAAIQGQSMADVPVGAFLSGGIDSSTVVALYQKHSRQPVRTFSIGFEEAGFNEAEDAKRVAEHLGTIHNEHYVTVNEARDVIPRLPSMYDEPFADPSQIPTYLVSRFAREQVKVAITGDGGDELFAGYNRHFAAPQLWQQLQSVPPALRSLTASTLSRLPLRFWSSAASLLPGRTQPHLAAKIQKALRVARTARSFDDVYASFLDEWSLEPSPVLGCDEPGLALDLDLAGGAPDPLRIMYCDAVTYLPDDILCKVDRASMAASLETRVPFLDHRVAELAARIPLDMKIRGGRGKHIVRQILHRHVPPELVERPKAGFAPPVGEWTKGPLRQWAEQLLDPAAMAGDGWFDPAIVRSRWEEHLAGRRDSTAALWGVLMFQAWLKEQRDMRAAAA